MSATAPENRSMSRRADPQVERSTETQEALGIRVIGQFRDVVS
jgi:hypothetical protein